MPSDAAGRQAAAFDLIEKALAASTADETEIIYSGSSAALTRFTRNEIHENLLEDNFALSVRAVSGKRIGVASTNALDAESIARTVARAVEIAKLTPADDAFPGLPPPSGEVAELPGAFDEATAAAGPAERADAVRRIAGVMSHHQLHGAGYVATRRDNIAVANSKGTRRFFTCTDASVNIKAIGDDSSGYAEGFSRRLRDLDFAALAETAASKAAAGTSPHALSPGEYTVVLEPPAFREFLGYLCWVGLSAQSLDEGSSFMAGRLGERLMGENVTIEDDFAAELGDGIPFDFEGVPRTPVTMIERGVAKDVVYDSYYAAKMHHANTGHALPAPNPDGPYPLNVSVDPGSRTQEQIVADIERGVLVSRTWYIRLVDQKKLLITGMTRDGLFLIENGKLTRGLKNMRFNESIVDALGRCELASVAKRSENFVVPAIRIDGFHFTSGTSF